MRRAILFYNLNVRLFNDLELLLTKMSLHDSIAPHGPEDLRDPDAEAKAPADEESTLLPTPDVLHPVDSESPEEEFS